MIIICCSFALFQNQELKLGRQSDVHTVTFTTSFTHQNLVETLLQSGCLIPVGLDPPPAHSPIILLEQMHLVPVAEIFGELLKVIEFRGQKATVSLQSTENENAQSYYLVENCYIIGTMHRSRSTGLELSIQQVSSTILISLNT